MIEGAADVRSGKGGITDVENTMLLCNFRNGIEIGQCQRGIGRALAENELGVGLNRRLDRFRIGKIHKTKFHPHRDELFASDAIGTAVAAVGYDAMIACFHERVDARCRCGHAGGNSDGIVTVFDFGNLFLEHLDGGIVRAAVAVAPVEVLVDGFLDEGRGHVDGSEDGAGFFVGYDSAVDDVGVHLTVGDPSLGLGAEGASCTGGAGCAAVTAVEIADPWR
mmetsp:Transcript_32686/g.68747  ORF Transcript_32686/g.68747 Transcript_32686/m.68747 type:complete len:222 (+) Transcript_32686:811-1476(+)